MLELTWVRIGVMKFILAVIAAAITLSPVAHADPEVSSPSILCQDVPGYPHVEEFCDQKPGYWEPNDKVAQ
jgi:hypothetical protein